MAKPSLIGRKIRFNEDLEEEYTATIVGTDENQIPTVLTVEVKYKDCVVVTQTTEDDTTYSEAQP